MMTSFRIKLQKTYFSMGFFNIPVDADGFFGNHDQPISIMVESDIIQGKINRTANTNKTARIMGTVSLRDWFQKHCAIMDEIEIEIINPTTIRLKNNSFSVHQSEVNKVVFCRKDDQFIEITPYISQPTDTYQEINFSNQYMIGLSSILSHSSVAALQTTALTSTYVLKFAPEIAQQLANGTLHMMPSLDSGIRAMAINSSGQIVGQASLVSAGQSVAIMIAAWHVLAVITAQHHMTIINKRLAAIEHSILSIKEFLESQDIDTLNAHIRYLHNLHETILQGKLGNHEITVFLTKIEDIDHDCERLFERFIRFINMKYKKIIEIEISGTFTVKDDLDEIKEYIKEYSYALDSWLLVAKLKLFLFELRYLLPINNDILVLKLESLKITLSKWYDDRKNDLHNIGLRRKDFSTLMGNIFKVWDTKEELEQFSVLMTGLEKYLNTEIAKVETLNQVFYDRLSTFKNDIHQTQLLIDIDENRNIKAVRYLLEKAQ